MDIGTSPLKLDVGPAIASLDALSAKSDAVRDEITRNNVAASQSYSSIARAAVEAQQKQAAANAELQGAQAALRSAQDAVREYTARQRELNQEQAKVNSTTAEYARLGKELDKNKQKLAEAKQAVKENREAVEAERAAVAAVTAERQKETQATKLTAAAARDAGVAAKEEAAAAKQAGAATEGASKGASGLQGLIGKAGAALAGFFAIGQLTQVAEEIVYVRSEFQKYETVLTNAYGGNREKAQQALLQVQQFADANGVSIGQLEDTFTKLVNRGIVPTTERLRQLSDIAATSGKSTDQFVEALLDAQTGEFERLKEFGIKVKQNGDTVAFTFRGIKTEVKNTQAAITEYLYSLGDLNGVQGTAALLAEQTAGKITTFKNSIAELFNTIGQGTEGPLNGFISRLTVAVKTLERAIQTSEQRAKVDANSDISRYQEAISKRLQGIADRAKLDGKDVGEALKTSVDDQVKVLEASLQRAKQRLREYNNSRDGLNESNLDKIENGLDPLGVGRAGLAAIGVTKNTTPREQLLKEIEAYQGKIKAAQDAGKAVGIAANQEVESLGRIEELRKKIAAETKRRDAAPNTEAGNDLREKLNAQLDADNRLLNELLGKVDKAAKAQSDRLASALRALQQERATLEGLAAKAAERVAITEGDRAKLVFDEALRQVTLIENKLKEREAAVAKAGGRGRNADGVVDRQDATRLTALREQALDAYYKEVIRISQEREQRLFDLRAESNNKEIQQLDRHYSDLTAKATDAIERDAIERARIQAQIALRQQQQQRLIDNNANGAANAANLVGETFGAGTGQSVIEAKRAEKRALLEIEQKHARDTYNNLKLSNTQEAQLAQQQAQVTIARTRNELNELDREKASHKATDGFYKLLFGDEDSDELRSQFEQTAQQAIGAINQILSAQLAAEQAKVQAHQENITSLQSQLAAEIQLNQEGSASNIRGIQEQIAAEKAAKREALAESRRIAKEQQLVNDLQAVSSISLAVANVIAGFSTVPLVGSILGIVAAAAMVASFVSTKASAASAARTDSFFVGGYTGDGDPRATSTAVGPRPYEYHRREFVIDHELTDQLRHPLLEPLHQRRPQDIDWSHPALAELLPDLGLPQKIRQEKAQHYRVQHEFINAPMQAGLDRVEARLAAIEGSNSRMADRPDRVPLGDNRYMEIEDNRSTHIINVQK